MALPAAHTQPAPETFDDGSTVCALDGDGTALCDSRSDVGQVNGFTWGDVPLDQRCPICAAIIGDHPEPH